MKIFKILIVGIIFLTTIFSFQTNIVYASQDVKNYKNVKVSAISIDNIMGSADDFIKQGELTSDIDEDQLHNTSNFLYNLFLGIGIITAVGVGIVLGIKYMVGSVDEKAELKQVLIGYLVSCIVIFGAFGIWKLVIEILKTM